jgi:hypothetical protein
MLSKRSSMLRKQRSTGLSGSSGGIIAWVIGRVFPAAA